MSPALISLAALLLTVAAGIVLRINPGVIGFALAYAVGVGVGGLRASDVTAGFPVQLFLVLVAVMLLFGQAQVNGTLSKLARQGVRLARGNVGMVPIVFFGLAVAIATMGGGNIAASALVAPIAMAAAGRIGISAFLMIIMVGNGVNAGAYSPIAPTGIVASQLMTRAGLPGMEWQTYWNTFMAQTFVAFAGYFLLGGLKLLRRPDRVDVSAQFPAHDLTPFSGKQRATLGVILALLGAVIALRMDIIVGAFAAVAVLLLARVADADAAIKAIPWGTILMVCGISTLVSVLEKTGGVNVIVDGLVKVSTPDTVTGVVALVSGLVSAYSSTIGVVLPTFLPTVPGLAQRLSADPMAIASSINVGGHLVDVSPLSTIGAICLAAYVGAENPRALFNKVLAWGLSMAVVGAVVCQVFFGLL
ncbi:MAG: C4-dicarboxylate ABC transporter [Gemmatimonadetes bacterium]|nr:C4-dicarboxylate ABC transporter [Gemmatimonadota bacterium]